MSVPICIRSETGERIVDVEDEPISIGGADSTISLADASGAESVALIGASGGRPFLQRLSSSHAVGVFLNEQAVETSGWLEEGSQIRVGELRLGFESRAEGWLIRVERIGAPRNQGKLDRVPIEVVPYHFAEESDAVRARRKGPLLFALAALSLVALAAGFVWATVSVGVGLTPVPDRIALEGGPSLRIGGRYLLRPGQYVLRAEKEGYAAFEQPLEIPAGEDPDFVFSLEPLPGRLTIRSAPVADARVWIGDAEIGRTPIEAHELPGGEYRLRATAPLHRSVEQPLVVEGLGREQSVAIELVPAWASLTVVTEPSGAALTIDGESVGTTPATIRAAEGPRQLSISLAGHRAWSAAVAIVAEEAQTVGPIQLERASSRETVAPRPAPPAPKVAVAPAPKPGAASHPTRLEPANASALLLMPGGTVTLGTPRGQQGRRSNEKLRSVELVRPFYLSIHEVSNQDFLAFRSAHESGAARAHTLRGLDQPVVRVTWEDAAAYCNWLSKQEGLPPAYVEQGGRLVPAVPLTTGFRLPTEAEWSFAARAGPRGGAIGKYPWGAEFPPPEGSANVADGAAHALLSTYLEDLDDGFAASAPVGRHAANALGIQDLGGNVSEWIHDYYSVDGQGGRDPTGPESGRKHVVRGSSFRHSSITQLRTAYRDSSTTPRDDLGFRIARYAE